MTLQKTWLRKTILILFLFEIFYLAVINLALSLPVTQSLINQIKPDKFAVSWENAWSWYPFRVHATGVSANGQTGSQQVVALIVVSGQVTEPVDQPAAPAAL